jgi:hypothetical protein
MTQRTGLIVQQDKLLKPAVSDYIDRIVDGRGLRQRVLTQPRPETDNRQPPSCGWVAAALNLQSNLK